MTGATAALLLALQVVPAELRERVEDCARKISERFVFFGGGSGVLISADGYALTNHHVAGTLKTTKVTLYTGKQYDATLICTDELGDVALFKIHGPPDEKFPYAELGDSDRLEMGQYVIACGNPFGITLPAEDLKWYPTITLGIVSALHRNQQTYFDCIQTDAAVNPGNSGGPLVTLDGRVVGINGRIATRYMNRVNSGVGYAIPSNQIRNFLPEMLKGGKGGKIYHAMVGGLKLADENTQGRGARVMSVKAGSTADKAGLKRGDMITRVNQYAIFNKERYQGAIGTYPEGTEVSLRVERDGEALDVKVTLDRYSPFEAIGLPSPERPAPTRPKGSAYLGVYVEETKEGLRVDDVRPDSPADQAGLLKGDLLLKINGRGLPDRNELNTRVWQRKPGHRVTFTVKRDGEELEVEVELGKHPDD
ncbi:MAG TPA: PDZ domain-containing protein [Planctomycetota bacterium]|nr:PDZ domain-containing protein [Planctomycetota bacterium]